MYEDDGYFSSSSSSSSCVEQEKDVRWLLTSPAEKKSVFKPSTSSCPSKTQKARQKHTKQETKIRTILHLDIDCFYCQCESNENPALLEMPFGIGQKHILVTCNYIAREKGIKKLMLKSTALKICPELIIIDGSDLTKYREQSRRIYMAFRNIVKQLPCGEEGKNLVMKGYMDEMYADITPTVEYFLSSSSLPIQQEDLHESIFVYGSQPSTISISEDQSGATATIRVAPHSHTASKNDYKTKEKIATLTRHLKLASHYAHRIQKELFIKQGFTTTIGISTNPMLAKIASDLRKPNSINLLYPWRASSILEKMPLRKIPQLGKRTLAILNDCLVEEHKLYSNHDCQEEEAFWTCSHLLRVPKHKIIACLNKSNAEKHVDLILDKCKGIDSSPIIDDGGRLAKTVSVEDSFRQGTVTTKTQILEALEILSSRLIPLIEERTIQAPTNSLNLKNDVNKNTSALAVATAYPTTIRLCIRNIKSAKREILQKQRSFPNGKNLADAILKEKKETSHNMSSFSSQSPSTEISLPTSMLYSAFVPLVHCLFTSTTTIKNVTRISIGVTNFLDIDCSSKSFFDIRQNKDSQSQKERTMHSSSSSSSSSNFTEKLDTSSNNATKKKKTVLLQDLFHRQKRKKPMITDDSTKHRISSSDYLFSSSRQATSTSGKKPSSLSNCSMPLQSHTKQMQKATENNNNNIDPNILKELPADIVEEILAEQKDKTTNTIHQTSRTYSFQSHHKKDKKKRKKRDIKDFFSSTSINNKTAKKQK